MKKIVVKLTQYQAEALGIVKCKCGCPKSSHFDFYPAMCSHKAECECKGYKLVRVALNELAK